MRSVIDFREEDEMQDLTSVAAAQRPRCPEVEQPSPAAAAAAAAEQLQCPRCESTNTKFCYYNNYNLAQPRHFCKDCRRYWTKGGSLRNIPVGGGTRRASKRSTAVSTATAANNPPKRRPSPSPSSPPSAISPASATSMAKPELMTYAYPAAPSAAGDHDDNRLLDFSGSLCSLLGTDGTFAQLLDNCFRPFNPTSAADAASARRAVTNLGDIPQQQQQSSGESNANDSAAKPAAVQERFLGFQGETNCWSNTGDGGGGAAGSGGGWPDLTIYTPLFKFQ